METAIKKLEVLLTKTENDVDILSHKLDQEFAALSDESETNSNVKLSELTKKVRDLRSELERVTIDIEEFQKSQKEVMNEVKERLAKVSDQFDELSGVAIAAQRDS